MVENTAALRCDLCSMYFVTPAEWVRHVQNQHTETELALSNNSESMRRSQQRSSRFTASESGERSCVICKKMFPNYASMIVHKRSHTSTSHENFKTYRD